MKSQKQGSLHTGALVWLRRCSAAFMLALLLPAAVLAAPLRYCMGQDGHRAIEFVHAKVFAHANSVVKDGAGLEAGLRDTHVVDPYCRDRLILPIVAKSKSWAAPRPSDDPVASNDFRFSPRVSAEKCARPARRLVILHLQKPDPRLVALRTVVLLN